MATTSTSPATNPTARAAPLPPLPRAQPGFEEQGAIEPEPMILAPIGTWQFRTREQMLAEIKDFASNQGYATVIARSRLNKLWLKCDRGGNYSDRYGEKPDQRRRRHHASRLTGCPFKARAGVKKDGIWRCHTEIAEHNHEPSNDPALHPSLRKMTTEQQDMIRILMEQGKTPIDTINEMKVRWPDIAVLRRDVYNARKRFRTEKELADAEAGGVSDSQVFVDPNGRWPGPTRNGKWVWLEDGDTVRKKGKRKRNDKDWGDGDLRNIAPELRDMATTSTAAAASAALGSPTSINDTRRTTRTHAGYGSESTGLQPVQAFLDNNSQHPGLRLPPPQPSARGPGRPSNASRQAPSQQQYQQQQYHHLPPMTPTPLSAGGGAGGSSLSEMDANAASVARMERLEKEQREQKEILARILGAITASKSSNAR